MEFTHFNNEGRAHMVEIGDEDDAERVAIARGRIKMNRETVFKVKEGLLQKGDVLSVSQVAGILGAKKTSNIIPMCHNIPLTGININYSFLDDAIEVEAKVKTTGKIGVGMEALTAVSIACLTIYDMCRAIDKDMIIEGIKLIKKTGGKSGDYYLCKQNRGRVLSVNRSDKKGAIKLPISEGLFIEKFGLENDVHAGDWNRQISLLGIESFEKIENVESMELVPGIFAENLTIEGLVLYELPIGTKLVIGETIQEVTQIGKECRPGYEIAKKVGKCALPLEGIFTKVLKGGIIKAGDIIEVI